MGSVYQFKPGSHLKGDPQVVGEHLDAIRNSGDGLTAEAVVQAARAKSSVLHSYFEWNDSIAANRYRIDQAGHLIRCVTVVVEQAEVPSRQVPFSSMPVVRPASNFRAFLPVTTEGGNRLYESTAAVLGNDDYRRQVLAQAHSELSAIGRKYLELKELAEVVKAIDRVGELLSEERLAPSKD